MTRTSSVLFWFGLIIIASLALYRTSDRVQALNRQLRDINASIENEQQSIHVLKAEWVYLANPQRIESMAKKHLAMRPTAPQQISTLDNLVDMLPTHNEAVGSVAVTSTPIANVKTSLAAMPPRIAAVIRRKTSTVTVASEDTGHVNDHMHMEHTASAQPLPGDSIGSLLTQLDTHP